MALYKIPSTRLLGNDSGNGIRVIAVQEPTNGYTMLGKVRMVATDVLYTPPGDQQISTDVFGYTIEDIYGQVRSANVRVKFPTPDPGCGLVIKYQGAFNRSNAQSCRIVGLVDQAVPGDFAIVSTIKYHRGNDDDFIETGWTKLQFNGIPYAYESGLYYRVLTQPDCDLINGQGLLLCTDYNANEAPSRRQIAGFALVVRTHLSWDESYVFSDPLYANNGNWASTQGALGTNNYAAYTQYGPSVDLHFTHMTDYFVYDDGKTPPDPNERPYMTPSFGNEVDNYWGKSAYHIAQYDKGQNGRDIPFSGYHISNTTDSYYNRLRLNFKTCAVDNCRFFIPMDRGISRSNFSSDRVDLSQGDGGFEGFKAGQFIVATICTTGTNGVFLPDWTKIKTTTAPAPANNTVSIYTHVVTQAEADAWNNGTVLQLVTATTPDSNTTAPTSSYLYGTISGNMRVFDICGLDPATIVVDASCDYYTDGATYTPEKRLGPIFYGSDLYFFNPTKVTPGIFPPASPIEVTPYMGIYTPQTNALQYTQLGFVSASETSAQPLGTGFTVTHSAGFMVARYVLRSTLRSFYE